MRLDFEAGVAVGQALEQIKEHGVQLTDHETRIGSLEGKAATAESWLGRAVTAGTLWAAGAGLNLSAESVGQMIAKLLR